MTLKDFQNLQWFLENTSLYDTIKKCVFYSHLF